MEAHRKGYNRDNKRAQNSSYFILKYTKSDLYNNCFNEWCRHQHELYVAKTESLVVCFVVGLMLPIYNGREKVAPLHSPQEC